MEVSDEGLWEEMEVKNKALGLIYKNNNNKKDRRLQGSENDMKTPQTRFSQNLPLSSTFAAGILYQGSWIPQL